MSLLSKAYLEATVVDSGRYQTTVNELCDQLPALRPELLVEVATRITECLPQTCTKLLVEEDKGAVIGAAVSIMSGIPLAMARDYTYSVPGVPVSYKSEYMGGQLYVNGIDSGDEVTIVDDTISTGGVVLALMDAVASAGGTVTHVIAAVNKVDNGGVARIRERTQATVSTLISIRIVDGEVRVMDESV